MNNLKQLGLAVQNYADVKKELPPAGLGLSTPFAAEDDSDSGTAGNNYATWAVLVFPFMEQQNLYDQFNLAAPLNDPDNQPASARQARYNSLESHLCPSRRQPPAFTVDAPEDGGAVIDYAAVGGSGPGAGQIGGDGAMLMCGLWQPELDADGNVRGVQWRSMVSFASISDGLSNTALFGEKFVPQPHLGKMNGDWDGPGYMSWNNFSSDDDFAKMGWSTRRMGFGLGLVRNKMDTGSTVRVRFGSYHPSTSQFVMCDGSVRNLDNMTSETVLSAMAGKADGKVVSSY